MPDPSADPDISVLARRWAELCRWVDRARDLHRRMSTNQAAYADPDLIWSLVLYVEYAGESIKALDRASGGKLLPMLGDVPVDDPDDRLSWSAMIRMRDLLAHRPGKIDHDVVRRTVEQDFPVLAAICAQVRFHDAPLSARDDATLRTLTDALDPPRAILIFRDPARGIAIARQSSEETARYQVRFMRQ